MPGYRAEMFVRRLDNGMRLLLDPWSGADVVALYIWINVGSGDEAPGLEGAAHMVEHMLFKGTERFGVGEVASAIEGLGGDMNAWTSFDETVFHATVPAAGAAAALAVLADMVVRPRFNPVELEMERKVILEEVRGCADDADIVLGEALYSRAYGDHPYGRPVIGFAHTVRAISRDALYGFWRDHYMPGNACLSISGPIDVDQMTALAASLFADNRKVPARRRVPAVATGHGRARVRRRFEAHLAEIAFPVPGHGHPDLPIIDTLCQALGGGGSAPFEREVRRATNGCVGAGMELEAEQLGSLAVASVQAFPGGMAETLESAEALLARLRVDGVSDADLRRAKAQIVADRTFRRESVDGRAHQAMFHQEVYGSPDAGVHYDAAVRAVTRADLDRVVQTWMAPERAVGVVLSPDPLPRPHKVAVARTVKPRPLVERFVLPNGLRVLLEPDEGGTVAVRVAGVGGQLMDRPGRAGLSALWSRLYGKGAGGLDAVGVASFVEGLGGTFGGVSGRSSTGLRLDLPAENLGDGIELMIDALLDPAFPEEEVARGRQELAEALRERDDHPEARLVEEVWKRGCGGHPWGLPTIGTERTLSHLDRPLMFRAHRAWARAENLVVAVTGGFDPDRVKKRLMALARLPRGWQHPWPEAPQHGTGSLTLRVPSEQAHVAFAYPALGVRHPDAPAMDVLGSVLGGQGGRLFIELREAHGLAYAVSASVQDGIFPGLVLCSMGTEPDRIDEATARLRTTMSRIAGGEISEEEVARARACLLGAAASDRQGAGGRASEAAWAELYGLDGAEYRSLVRRVDAVDGAAVRRVAAGFAEPRVVVRLVPKPGSAR